MPKLTFVNPGGSRLVVDAPLGASVLEIAHEHGIDLEGACEGSMACSTCHVIVDPAFYDRLEEVSEDEADMLDLAYGLSRTWPESGRCRPPIIRSTVLLPVPLPPIRTVMRERANRHERSSKTDRSPNERRTDSSSTCAACAAESSVTIGRNPPGSRG